MNAVAILSFLLLFLLKSFSTKAAEIPNERVNITALPPENERENKETASYKSHEVPFFVPLLKFLFSPIFPLSHFHRTPVKFFGFEKGNSSTEWHTFDDQNISSPNGELGVNSEEIPLSSSPPLNSQNLNTGPSTDKSPDSSKLDGNYAPYQSPYHLLLRLRPRHAIQTKVMKSEEETVPKVQEITEGEYTTLESYWNNMRVYGYHMRPNQTSDFAKRNCFRRFVYMMSVEWKTVVVHIIIAMIFALSITLAMLLCYSLMPGQGKGKETGINKPAKGSVIPTKYIYV